MPRPYHYLHIAAAPEGERWRVANADDDVYSRHATEAEALETVERLNAHVPITNGFKTDRKRQFVADVLTEYERAVAKFPGDNVTGLALMEEVGELATAMFEEPFEAVRKEAVQVAVMAMRVALEGDHTVDDWRAEKGLDALPSAKS